MIKPSFNRSGAFALSRYFSEPGFLGFLKVHTTFWGCGSYKKLTLLIRSSPMGQATFVGNSKTDESRFGLSKIAMNMQKMYGHLQLAVDTFSCRRLRPCTTRYCQAERAGEDQSEAMGRPHAVCLGPFRLREQALCRVPSQSLIH